MKITWLGFFIVVNKNDWIKIKPCFQQSEKPVVYIIYLHVVLWEHLTADSLRLLLSYCLYERLLFYFSDILAQYNFLQPCFDSEAMCSDLMSLIVFVTSGWSLRTSRRTTTRWRSATWPPTPWPTTRSATGRSACSRETGSAAPPLEAAGTSSVRPARCETTECWCVQRVHLEIHQHFSVSIAQCQKHVHNLDFFWYIWFDGGLFALNCPEVTLFRWCLHPNLKLCIFHPQTHSGPTRSSSCSWRTLTMMTTCAAWWSLWCRRTDGSWGRRAWTWRPSALQCTRSERSWYLNGVTVL